MTRENDLSPGQALLVAGALLTRLPLPHASEASFDGQARAVWAYPVVGAGLGLLAAAVWVATGWLGLLAWLQAGLTLGVLVMMTGALHEDGLADTADGLWGGTTRERRLEIMRDSRIGSYGVIALVLGLMLRWGAMIQAGPWGLIAAASLSRGVLPLVMARVPHARPDGLAHRVGRPSERLGLIALAIGAAVAVLCGGIGPGVLALALVLVAAAGMASLARAKIGGVTGDILGATQQVCELAVLVALAV